MNIRFDTFNVFISALELFKLYVKIPSNSEFSLANTLSGLKEELRDGFAPLRENCPKSMTMTQTLARPARILFCLRKVWPFSRPVTFSWRSVLS